MTNVLLLTAGTGGGHIAVADALADALRDCLGDERGIMSAAPLGQAVDSGYGWMLTRAPRLWGACYAATDCVPGMAVGRRVLGVRYGRRFASLVAQLRPAVIISVHALCTQVAAAHMRARRDRLTLHCVVTDLIDVHRSWVAPEVSTYFVATQAAAAALEGLGVPPTRIQVVGLPLRRPFWTPCGGLHAATSQASPRDCAFESRHRRRLRVLAMDGGVPGPQLTNVLRILAHAGVPLDITAARGSRAPLARSYEIAGRDSSRICTLGRGESIAQAMRDADLVVTKAGSLTIAEALAVGRPILLHRAAPGQEKSNPAFVERVGAGLSVSTRESLIDTIRFLADSPETRALMGLRAQAYGRPGAALDTAARVVDMTGAGRPANHSVLRASSLRTHIESASSVF